MGKFRDLTGMRFGKLVVLIATKNRQKSSVIWKCKCDCGNICFVSSQNIVSGGTTSCGCYRKSIISKPFRESSFLSLFNKYKINANSRNLVFNLSIDEFKFLTSQNCFYCGKEPIQQHNKKRSNGSYLYNGIDRLDNNIGYIFSNCVPCCKECNFSKASRTPYEFVLWILKISKNFNSTIDIDTFCDIIRYVDTLKEELDRAYAKGK